jgi:O-antigen/teichoic acid export membrane protein
MNARNQESVHAAVCGPTGRKVPHAAFAKYPLLATLYPLARDSMIYLVGAVVVGLGNFALVPLYTRFLPPADFGAYALIEISLLIAVTFTQLGLGTTYLRWYAETAPARRGEILASSLGAGSLAAIIGGFALSLIVRGPLGGEWLAGHRLDAWLLWPIVFLRTSEAIFFSSLQAAQRPMAYGLAAVTRLLGLVSAGYWFVAVHPHGVGGVLRGWLVGDAACVLVLMVCCLPNMRLRVRWQLLRPMLRYGLPLVWTALMALLLDATGRYFLARFQNLSEVARYAVGVKITNILSMGFLQPFGNAWSGAAFPIAHRPNAPMTYTKIIGYALIVAALLAALTILFAPLVIGVFAGAAYSTVQRLLPWLLLPVILRLLEYWSSLPIYLQFKTHWLGPLATVETVLCVLLNYSLVPRFGALGAALAWTVSLAGGIAAVTLIGRRYYPLPFDWRTFGFAVSLWAIAVAASPLLSASPSRQTLAVSVFLSIAFVIACSLYFLWDIRTSRTFFQSEAYAAD